MRIFAITSIFLMLIGCGAGQPSHETCGMAGRAYEIIARANTFACTKNRYATTIAHPNAMLFIDRSLIWDLYDVGPRANGAIMNLLADRHPANRQFALIALTAINGERAAYVNALSLNDSNPQVRRVAVFNLATLLDGRIPIYAYAEEAKHNQDPGWLAISQMKILASLDALAPESDLLSESLISPDIERAPRELANRVIGK